MNVFVLNSGSSSLKFQLIATDTESIRRNADVRLLRGEVEHFGGDTKVTFKRNDGTRQTLTASLRDVGAALDFVIRWVASEKSGLAEVRKPQDVHAVGHRVVHGGERFTQSVVVTEEVLKGIEACSQLAPLHNPDNVKGIVAAQKILGAKVPQVAVFDTAFHHSIPEHAYAYAIPFDLYERHSIRRYGFHGTSHRFVAGRYQSLRNLTPEQTNLITLHLGNGCSVSAIKHGRSVDTSMGMTPLEGLVMGSRSGDLDPAVVSVIAEKERLSAQEVEALLNKKSGLLGVSGITNDMRELQTAAKDGNRRAQLAIEMFCYRARKYIGAYLAAMGGAGGIVFTGGIGENSPEIRAQICAGMDWAGITIDAERNKRTVGREGLISGDSSKLAVYAIPTDEELLIARDTVRCVLDEAQPSS
jgi:acetate kinase